jgi:hypothetical protein
LRARTVGRRLALPPDGLDTDPRVGEDQADPIVGAELVRFEEPAQPQQLARRPELKVQRSAAVGVDGGYGAFVEDTLQAIGELNGARTHAHARQVDLESVRWSYG